MMRLLLGILLFASAALGATCVGDDPCKACKDCSQCKLCNSGKASCGVIRAQTDAEAAKRLAKRQRAVPR